MAEEYNHLQRAQAKAIYNFHKRKEQQEEEERLKQQLKDGSFFEEQFARSQKSQPSQNEDKKGK